MHLPTEPKRWCPWKVGIFANFVYLYEPRLGVSKARNCAWPTGQGRYIAWLDDDARACPGWVEAVMRRFDADKAGDIGELGGGISPIWGVPPPHWLTEPMRRSLTILSWSETPRFLQENEWLAAANIAYRKSTLDSCGGFNERLGRIGNKLLSGAENDLGKRIRAKGLKAYYDPSMAVAHYIHPERLKKKWFFKRSFGQGMSEIIAMRTSDGCTDQERLSLLSGRYGRKIDPEALISDLLSDAKNGEEIQQKINRYKQLGEIFALLGKDVTV